MEGLRTPTSNILCFYSNSFIESFKKIKPCFKNRNELLRCNLEVLSSAVACNNAGMQHEHFHIPQLAVCCANKTRSVRLYKITNRMQTTSHIFATCIFQGPLVLQNIL